MLLKKKWIILLMVFCFGAGSVFVIEKAISPFIDRKEISDYTVMNFLKNKIEIYKKHCGHYPDQTDGLEVLLEKNKESCFPHNEKISEVPRNYNDEMFLYFEKDKDFFIVNPSSNKAYITSKNTQRRSK